MPLPTIALGVYDKVKGLDSEADAKNIIANNHPIRFKNSLLDELLYAMIEEMIYRLSQRAIERRR